MLRPSAVSNWWAGSSAVEEGGEAGADRPGAEQRNLGDAALAQPFVPLGEEAELVVGALDERLVVVDRDDRGGDRQRVEIALADGSPATRDDLRRWLRPK